jgi:hypothetical protein
MAKTVTLGGDRLGSGKKQRVTLHGFERSNHDLGYVWRSTMATGTLVPFMNMLALPGDTFDINLGADVKTHPTLGPLFASFKLQLDVFQCPLRLYNSQLHNNKLNVGLNMQAVALPYMKVKTTPSDFSTFETIPLEFQQFNQSSLLAYLGLRGLPSPEEYTEFKFAWGERNATALLSYWDIYKNYYANKQEEIGYCIHTEAGDKNNFADYLIVMSDEAVPQTWYTGSAKWIPSDLTGIDGALGIGKIKVAIKTNEGGTLKSWLQMIKLDEAAGEYTIVRTNYEQTLNFVEHVADYYWYEAEVSYTWTGNMHIGSIFAGDPDVLAPISLTEAADQINLLEFPLDNIDRMREQILAASNGVMIDAWNTWEPYCLPLKEAFIYGSTGQSASFYSQEALAIKTYQSDIFNAWLNTEWIEGDSGINGITAIDTTDGSFTLDTLNLSKKVYDMLNRIAVSGGSYDDWLEAVYDANSYRKAETPMYMGGLSKEIIFQEVVSSTAATTGSGEQSLGALGGRGTMANKHKGGSMTIHVDEPSIIMGIVSITPRVDYYQGNDWTMNLKTFNDFHKPNLDEIGFQDLLTDQMAFWDTKSENLEPNNIIYSSAGKQPAWINYMTNFNKLYGNFADERNEMYMTLARRYKPDAQQGKIKDLTTYIDPSQFNYAFAQTDLTAQNFWVQIGVDVNARRKMSAKIMPNL